MTYPLDQMLYTYADYLEWPEDERWEILDGFAFMQAAPSPHHQEALVGLCTQFYNFLTGKPCKVYPAPFAVRLPEAGEKKNGQIRNVVEPDISIICDKSKIDGKGCKGAPDLIVEIMSPSSLIMDMKTKFNKYESAGVKEYWMAQPEAKLVSVFVLQETKKYGRPEHYSNADKIPVSIFPDLLIDLGRVWGEA